MGDAMAAAKCIDDLKEAGLSYDQARVLVVFIVRSQEHLATREDIKALKNRIDGVEVKIDAQGAKNYSLDAKIDSLDAKIDSVDAKIDSVDAKIDSVAVELKAEMKAIEARFTRQLYVFGFGIIGTIIAMLGLFLALLTQLQIPAG